MNSAVAQPSAPVPSAAGRPPNTRTWLLLLGLLLLATTAVYSPVHRHPFLNMDDNGYVSANERVQSGLSLSTAVWAFTTFDDANWHPLTWVAHAANCQLFGVGPAGHHDVNLLLHLINVGLLFWVLWTATGFPGRSLMVAALFALHPLNVESVAWIAELKTMLSMMFFLLTLGAYRWYAQRPRWNAYCVVLLLFAAGLMAKPQIITLPAVLLLWDYWPLERMRLRGDASMAASRVPPRGLAWLLWEKVPLAGLSLLSALLTLLAQKVGRPEHWPYTLPLRLENALVSYARYVEKMFWPVKLAPMYLHPEDSIPAWQVLMALVFLAAVTAVVFRYRRYRYLAVGWLWFLGTMVPMIGLVQVGRQSMADRYAYLPMVGLFLMVCWGASDWTASRRLPRPVLPAVGSAILVVLALATYHQVGYWGDNVTLWSHTVDVTTANFVAEYQLGGALGGQGRPQEGLQHYYRALAIKPDNADINLAIAVSEHQAGNLAAAVEPYRRFLAHSMDPKARYTALINLGHVYRRMGDTTKAEECFQAAARISSPPSN